MQKVIEIYLREKKPDVSTRMVYRKYIYPIYPISISTLYNYLNTPVIRQLKKIDEKLGPNLFNQE